MWPPRGHCPQRGGPQGRPCSYVESKVDFFIRTNTLKAGVSIEFILGLFLKLTLVCLLFLSSALVLVLNTQVVGIVIIKFIYLTDST